MVDEFNEYLFDFTSKIPVVEIEKAKESSNNQKEVFSPYTKVSDSNNKFKIFVITFVVLLLLVILGYFVISGIHHDDFLDNNTTYVIGR